MLRRELIGCRRPTGEWGSPTHVPFWSRLVSPFSRFAFTELYVALHLRSTGNRPSLVRPRVEAGRVGPLSPGLRTADYSFARPGRDTWTSQGSSGLLLSTLLERPCLVAPPKGEGFDPPSS